MLSRVVQHDIPRHPQRTVSDVAFTTEHTSSSLNREQTLQTIGDEQPSTTLSL
jgi:hypothetical protein